MSIKACLERMSMKIRNQPIRGMIKCFHPNQESQSRKTRVFSQRQSIANLVVDITVEYNLQGVVVMIFAMIVAGEAMRLKCSRWGLRQYRLSLHSSLK